MWEIRRLRSPALPQLSVCLPIDRSPSAPYPFVINQSSAAPCFLLHPPCSCGPMRKEEVEEWWNINQTEGEVTVMKWAWRDDAVVICQWDDCSWACKLLPGVDRGVAMDGQPGFIFRTRQGLIMLINKSILDKYMTFKLRWQKLMLGILCLQ